MSNDIYVTEFFDPRPYRIAMTVQSYLGVKANTAETNYDKGWEALARKLQERYPAITDTLINRFKKEQSIDLMVEQFMKFVGCHVKFNNFVWALYESGNNFVAEYIKQAQTRVL